MKQMPPEPTEEMLDNARLFLNGLELGIKDFKRMSYHLAMGKAFAPDWLLRSEGHINKMAKARYIYDAMYAAAPNIEHEEIAKQIPEALRQAIIKDFVEGLKPKAFLYRELSGNGFKETVSTNDVLDKFEVVNGKKVIPLYSLEEWK